MMNRADRRAVVREQHRYAGTFPAQLAQLPREKWPAQRNPNAPYPVAVWVSSKYLVQQFNEANAAFPCLIRLSVNRSQMGTAMRFEDGLTWDELQSIKSEIGFGDWYGVEVYPPDAKVVNVANMRHLWLLPTPLPIGWMKGTG